MQILTFTVAGQPYAIESREVIEVLPLVPVRPIPLMPAYVRGVFTYRGRILPLVDLCSRFVDGAPEGTLPHRLSTRVIVVEFTPRDGAEKVRLGLIAENVVSIRSAESAQESSAQLDLGHSPFLGRLLRLGGQTVQIVVVEHVLPADLLEGLFSKASGASGT
jgi:chemotaxis-related protein WspB